MTPPDSGEVAICPSCRQRLNGPSPSCRYSTRHYVGPSQMTAEWAEAMRIVEIPSPLAQRILAALEASGAYATSSAKAECRALADELRAIVERKT